MFDFIENYEADKNVSINYIYDVERKFNIKIPNILKEFYLKYNYSTIKECNFNIISLGSFCVEGILSLKYGNFNFEKEYTSTLENDCILKEYIPFATNIDGDYFYWNSNDEKVYYISHEDVESPTLICNNVDEFFKILNNCCKEEILIPNLNVKNIVDIDNTMLNDYKKILKYKGKLVLLLSFFFLALSLFSCFYLKPDDYFFANILGFSGLVLLFIDLNRRINSNITLKKHDINILESELKDATKLHEIDTYLTKNYIISNSKRIRITKYDDIKWIFVPSPKGKKTQFRPNDIAYSFGKTPIVAYLKNKKKVTVALVKINSHIKQIFNEVVSNNKTAIIGNTPENKKRYEKINSIYKLKNKIEQIVLYVFLIFCFLAIIFSAIREI